MKKYHGNFLGIVVQNNDPEFRGRVKVWVPHVSATIYDGWNRDRKDKKFKFLGKNIDSPLSGEVLEDLKTILPWAEYCAPSVGTSGSGLYKSSTDEAFISDSNHDANRTPISESNVVFKKYRQNLDNVGEKAGKTFETINGAVNDAFSTTSSGANKVNVNSYNYKPSTYSNAAKGVFSIPNVGAHVWLFFREGNPMFPVYFGVSFNQDDFASIYDPSQDAAQDYPQGYENSPTSTQQYRSKFVLSQKGGSLEIVNSDKRESVKLSHYSGSFKEYNNQTAIELIANNSQRLVRGDLFDTVNGHANQFVGLDNDLIIKGDSYRKVGNLDKSLLTQWVALYQDIANAKGVFEIKRAPFVSARYSSALQVRSGSFGNCPSCGGSGTVLGSTCGTCGGSGLSPSSQDGTWATDSNKASIPTLLASKATALGEIERKMGIGGSEFLYIQKHKIESVGLLLNRFNAIRVDPVGTLDFYAVTVANDGLYQQKKEFPLIEKVHVDDLPGGTHTHFVGNKYDLIVGAGGYRMKSYGNVDIAGAITTFIGDQVIIASSNDVTIDGGKRLNLISDSINLKSRNGKQITVEGNFGVSKNVVIGGGAHIEGELNVQHITAPLEFQITEPVHIKTTCTITNLNIPALTQADGANKPITAPTATATIELDVDHTHYFRNIPLSLVDGNTGSRTDSAPAVNTDSATPRTYKAIQTGRKGPHQSTNIGPDNGPPPNS
jgi:hypothetical protein